MKNSETIGFGRSRIEVTRSQSGEIEEVCINDICAILRKPYLLTNGAVGTHCPTQRDQNGKSYAPIAEVRELILSVRKSKHQKATIRALVQLMNSLSANTGTASAKNASSGDGLIPIMYNGKEFQARTINGRLMFNVTEMARGFEKKSPYIWLNLASTKQLMKSIVGQGKAPDVESLTLTTAGRVGATWLDSTLLIEYGRFISSEFAMWCDEILMKLFSEGYVSMNDMAPGRASKERLEKYVRNYLPPSTMDEALTLCEEQHVIIQEYLPKVEYYDSQVEQREWFTNSFVANELDISVRALNAFLEEEGVIVKRNNKWQLTEEFRGIPLRTEVYYDNNPNLRCVWTHYGRDYIHEIWNLRNGR